MNLLWEPSEETADMLAELIECLRACAENDVPLMVAHPYIGFERHDPTPEGAARFEPVVREAQRLGVKIALENTEGQEYLATLMAHFRGEKAVGFCWDSGHEMCYNRSEDMLALYGDRLLGTHLNDNLGVRDYAGRITYLDDLHLLPFDGAADWEDNMRRLDVYKRQAHALRHKRVLSLSFQPVRSTLWVLYLPLGKRIRSPFSSRSYSFLDFAAHAPRPSRGRIVSMI